MISIVDKLNSQLQLPSKIKYNWARSNRLCEHPPGFPTMILHPRQMLNPLRVRGKTSNFISFNKAEAKNC